MFEADHIPSVEVRRRRSHRHRSTRSRVMRKVKNGWRRSKLKSMVFTAILAALVVVGGYKATMYVLNHQVDLDEFRTSNK
jgi:hypothetical protein